MVRFGILSCVKTGNYILETLTAEFLSNSQLSVCCFIGFNLKPFNGQWFSFR